MTDYGAYDAGLKCENSSCKSFGKPHPNCRCHPGLASGGEVKPYCITSQPHRSGCKYFKSGGDVHPDDIPQHLDTNLSVASYLVHGGIHKMLKPESGDPKDVLNKYNGAVQKGHKLINHKVESMFGDDKSSDLDHTKAKKDIDVWVSKGGVNNDIQNEILKQPMNMAAGGAVEHQPGILHQNVLADKYPDHNVLLQEAKGRVSNYLGGLKPTDHQPKLAFDDPPDDSHQKKAYEHGLATAAHPLGVMDEIRKGTVEPEHVAHFKAMYPEVNDVIQQKLTKRIVEAQLAGEKPMAKVRAGLSMLMGAPLSGELSPQNIMAAQATFQTKQSQPGSQQPAAGGSAKPSALQKVDQSYMTAGQAAASRQQKQ